MSELPRCALCRKRPAVPAFRPFCSARCRMVDLGRWLSGDYRVAGASAPTSTDATTSVEADDANAEDSVQR